MQYSVLSLALLGLPLAYTQTITAAATTTAAGSVVTPGSPCSGNQAVCAGGPIILRCNGNTLQPGNCADNLGEPPLGALCVEGPAPSSASCSAVTPATTTTAGGSIPTNGATCTGSQNFCAGGPIILRCTDGKLQAGNCDDNLNEPPLGALCVSYGVASASCSAVTPATATGNATTTTSSSTSGPTPGQSCTGGAVCAGGPIILRCGAGGTLQPGNCDDNLNEPPQGALCVEGPTPSSAFCSAIGSGPISTGGSGGGNGTIPTSTAGGNGSFPGSTNTPTVPTGPIATAGADPARSWAGAVVVGAAALVAGGAMVL